jgi:hypothetical protein
MVSPAVSIRYADFSRYPAKTDEKQSLTARVYVMYYLRRPILVKFFKKF